MLIINDINNLNKKDKNDTVNDYDTNNSDTNSTCGTKKFEIKEGVALVNRLNDLYFSNVKC